jgi:hypothetical protein
MISRLVVAAVTIAIAVATGTAAGAAPPVAGVLVPGESLGGVRLGWSLHDVERVWGPTFGRCRTCPEETRYFNRVPFRPEGAAVALRRGRVVAVVTLWAPSRWHTDRNVYVGEPERRVRTTHGDVRRVRCDGYEGLVLRRRGAGQTVVFVVDRIVWGFGLLADGERVCR